MWLLYSLLINSILAHSLLLEPESTQSSNHQHPSPDCIILESHVDNNMCFAKTKTLKLLREKNHDSETIIDLGFNWADNCDYLPYDSVETLATNKNDLRIIQLTICS